MTDCIKRKQYGDRTYKSSDLWRVYCNYLSEEERLAFRREFIKTKGSCGEDYDPCRDLKDVYDNGIEAIETVSEAIDDVTDLVDETVEDINGVVDNITDAVGNIMKSEEVTSSLDDKLKKVEPNPIDRALLVDALVTTAITQVVFQFQRQGFVGDLVGVKVEKGLATRGKLVTSLSKSVKVALVTLTATAVAFKGLYDVYIDTCVEDK